MKAFISKKARKILNDPKGSEQLMKLIVNDVKEGEVELSDGTKFTVTVAGGATISK